MLLPFLRRRKKVTTESISSNIERSYDANLINQLIDAESMLNRRVLELQSSYEQGYANPQIDLTLSQNTDNKNSRIVDNWRLASTPEISWCINEILSEVLNTEANLVLGKSYENLNMKSKELIDNEFYRFINLFNFNSEQFKDDLLHFIVEGELAYEAIISEDNPEFGIIGIRRLYSSNFTAVNSPIISNGFVLNIDVDSVFNSVGYFQNANVPPGGIVGSGFQRSSRTTGRLVFNKNSNQYETDDRHVALTFPNVSYICYGKYNINNILTPFSLLDSAREPYFQLAVLQQAAVVMRVTRSPERLLFNIDTGGMSDKVAHNFIRKFGNALSKKKTVLPDGNISQQYNPATMLESWVFGKSANSSGTTVETVASTASYDEIDDIKYFHNRLLNIFKIPYSRIEDPTKQYITNSNNLTYDETRFYKFIQSSIQNKFNNALSQLFYHHLKLKNISFNESDFSIKFDLPARYKIFLDNEVISTKLEIYSSFSDKEEFNKQLLMRKYLDMSIPEIRAHYNMNKKIKKIEELEEADFDYNSDMGERDFESSRSSGFEAFGDIEDSDSGGEEFEEPENKEEKEI